VLDWYRTLNELIDMRSFSSLWYWIGLVVMWSGASHFILGVPYDLVARARRQGGAAEEDLRDVVRVQVNRLLLIDATAGAWLLGLGCFALTTLALLGFVYGVELAQAVFLLALPMSVVFTLSIRTARAIRAADGEGLHPMLIRLRRTVQALGVLSIFVTALWGMLQNMALGPI
jgi:hypothetical protein